MLKPLQTWEKNLNILFDFVFPPDKHGNVSYIRQEQFYYPTVGDGKGDMKDVRKANKDLQ